MHIDFRLSDTEILPDEGPRLVTEGVGCWQVGGDIQDREALKILVDQMWDAVEKKANELQGSKP